MLSLDGLSLPVLVGIFLVSALAILLAGTRLARIADTLADRTGLGEIIAGALFVGAATSLPGAITSMATAAEGYPGLAIGNGLGGITAQTAFIAIADLVYRRANLEHAAASATGLCQGVLLIVLIAIPLIAASQPQITVWGVHPASILIVAVYGLGIKLLTIVQTEPMWAPVDTDETREEISEPEPESMRDPISTLWLRFVLYAGITAVAGYLIGITSIALVDAAAASETVMGTVFAAVANSLPELVTAIAAVRIGAVSLAVGDVIGGNAFEVLFLSAADVFYDGSVYGAFSPADFTTALVAVLMTGVLLLGMIRREKHGIAGIGFESAIVLALYAGSVVLLAV